MFLDIPPYPASALPCPPFLHKSGVCKKTNKGLQLEVLVKAIVSVLPKFIMLQFLWNALAAVFQEFDFSLI